MNFNLQSKPIRYGLTLIGFLIFIGVVKTAGGQTQSAATATDIAVNTEQLMSESKELGKQEAIEQTVTGTPDALLLQSAALLSKSSELTSADITTLVCARGNAYLVSAQRLATESQVNAEAWLQNQLKLENDSVKALMVKYGSMSGDASQMLEVTGHLVNRAAIIYALTNIGNPTSCRVQPYDSAQAIDELIYRANQLASQRGIAGTQEAQ